MFTIAQYIEMNKLEVDPRDAGSTKLIAAHLRGLGYSARRVRGEGKSMTMWSKSDKVEEKEKLLGKLQALEVAAKGKKK